MSLIDDERHKTPKLRLGGTSPASSTPPATPPPPPDAQQTDEASSADARPILSAKLPLGSPPATPPKLHLGAPSAPEENPSAGVPPASDSQPVANAPKFSVATPPGAKPVPPPIPTAEKTADSPPPADPAPQSPPATAPAQNITPAPLPRQPAQPAPRPELIASSTADEGKPRPAGIAVAIGILALLLLIAGGSIYWIFIGADSPADEQTAANEPTPTPANALDNALKNASKMSPETAALATSIQEETGLVDSLSDGEMPPPSPANVSSTENLSVPPSASPAPTNAPSNPTPTRRIIGATDSAETAPAETPAQNPAPVPDPELVSLVETIPVSGIRPAGNESRAMINGELYVVGDQIAGTDLRFIATNSRQLIFQDSRGAIYRRNF